MSEPTTNEGEGASAQQPAINYKGMHWSALKKLLEERGLVYASKEQAIEVLTALPAEGEVVVAPVVTGGKFLDKKQPYGAICGSLDECPTACFTQGGGLYNIAGEKVG